MLWLVPSLTLGLILHLACTLPYAVVPRFGRRASITIICSLNLRNTIAYAVQ